MSIIKQNIRLDISYDGTNYSGWQTQINAVSIQDKITKALKKHKIPIEKFVGAGRTDAGVHAKAQTANLVTTSQIEASKFQKILNSSLPEDIRILNSQKVDMGFHSRYSALAKHYSYRVYLGETMDPFLRNYVWHYNHKIDLDLVRQAASKLTGLHDFKAFKNTGSIIQSSVRNIYLINTKLENNILYLDFIGNGFLYNMVRILVGTILQIGSGKLSLDILSKDFRELTRQDVGVTAPAKGLFLENVFYNQAELRERIESFKIT